MEFNEKLQELRKQRKLTQEELAEALHVSRAAVSKWESGRGYPGIDSLKAIARFFSVSIDSLLSGEELLTLAEASENEKDLHFHNLVFGLLDLSSLLFLFFPFFAQRTPDAFQAVSLLSLTEITLSLRLCYFMLVMGTAALGITTLALQNCRHSLWLQHKHKLSLGLNVAAILLFILGLHPYAAVFSFLLLLIKVLFLKKKQ